MSILGTHRLRIALDNMDIMKPDRGDLDRAHVLWLGPSLVGEDARRLTEICGTFCVARSCGNRRLMGL
jgi:activating signal cointegrator complex subunit 1